MNNKKIIRALPMAWWGIFPPSEYNEGTLMTTWCLEQCPTCGCQKKGEKK